MAGRRTHKYTAALFFILSLLLVSCGAGGDLRVASRDGTVTFAWISDTQYYSAYFPDTFMAMTNYIADEAEAGRVDCVLHTGDVVDYIYGSEQWDIADGCMSRLDGVVPYVVAAGNHDTGMTLGDYSEYGARFGAHRFNNTPGFTVADDGRFASYKMSAGGVDWLIVALGYNCGEDAVNEAALALEAEPDRTAVLITHDFLDYDGSRSVNGQYLWDTLVVPYDNVRLVLCGHVHSAARRVDTLDSDGDGAPDRSVVQLLADYQNTADGGGGCIRFLSFDPGSGELTVDTYSPAGDATKCGFGSESDFFTVPFDFNTRQ